METLPKEVKAAMFEQVGKKFIPKEIIKDLPHFEWICTCGAHNMGLSLAKNGSITGYCYGCGLTFFINDWNILILKDPFSFTKDKPRITRCKNGWWSYWFPKGRVKVFSPKRKRLKFKRVYST